MRKFFLLSVLLALIIACKNDEEIITGDIAGTVRLHNQYNMAIDGVPGIPVSLNGNDVISVTVNTDESGQFVFEDIPYGKYTTAASKEGYFLFPTEQIDHLGGSSATYTEVSLFAIPTFQLELDSVAYVGTEKLSVYLKLDGDTLFPPADYGLYVMVFASNSPDVDKDRFESVSLGNLSDRNPAGNQQIVRLYARILTYNFQIPIDQLKTEPIYFRLYPIAWGGFGGTPTFHFDPLSLGKPSNVLSFDWDEVVDE